MLGVGRASARPQGLTAITVLLKRLLRRGAHEVALADLDAEALRLGRFRRHPRSGTWSARFALEPGPDGEAALDRVEDLAVRLGRAGGLDADGAVFVGVALREAVVNAFRHGRGPEGARSSVA